MKKKKTLFSKTIALGLMALFLMSFALLLSPDPPPPGYTNSPFDGNNCTACHGDYNLNAGTGTVSITSNVPGTGYLPLDTYLITATVNHTGLSEFQFELSPQKSNGQTPGALIANAQTQIQGGPPPAAQYISGSSSTLSNPNGQTWTFSWKAPATSTEPITFYAAFNASNGNGGSDGDYIYATSLTIEDTTPITIAENDLKSEIKIFSNPVKNNFLVEITSSVMRACYLKVINLEGKAIFDEKIQLVQGKNIFPITLNRGGYEGIYFLELVSGKNSTYLPMVVIK
ncbi:MAG: T9SS type A sorting domain-containing protein [Bacteroidetes bacterium]|nr:T9SS type A sorting domain-containing protein [Bacteroidota bacterium]